MVKENLTKAKTKMDMAKYKLGAKLATASGVGTAVAMSPVAFASGDVDATATNLIGSLGGFVASMFMYIGIFLLIISIGQLVMAMRNEDAEGKTKALQQAMVSIMLIAIKPLINVVLDVADVGVQLD